MAGEIIADRVLETTTTSGTGTLNLAGAETGYQTFVAGIGDGKSTWYCIEDLTTGDWEIGIGTVTDAAPDTLSRDTVIASSNAGAKVNLAGNTANVFVGVPASLILSGTRQGIDQTYDIQPREEGAVAGNNRAENAVDLQTYRGAATEVASGNASVIGGGRNNTASGNYSAVGGGYGNNASAVYTSIGGGVGNKADDNGAAVGGGSSNYAYSDYDVIGGGSSNRTYADQQRQTIGGGGGNIVDGQYGTIGGGLDNYVGYKLNFVGGGQENKAYGSSEGLNVIGGGKGNKAYGEYNSILGGGANETGASYTGQAILGGANNKANEDYACCLGGLGNQAYGVYSSVLGTYAYSRDYGQHALACGKFAAVGDCQHSDFHLRASVTHDSDSWATLYLDGSSEEASVPSNSAWTFTALVVGTTSGCTKSFSYRLDGIIENDGGTTTILNQLKTVLYEDDADFDCQAVADDANDTLEIQVRDSTSGGDTVRWSARLMTTEVTF